MSKRLFACLLIVSALLTSGLPIAALARGAGDFVAQRGGQAGVSLNDAVQQVQRETGGRVLSAETVNQNGRMVHRIKVLTASGQVRVVVIDAQAGGR
jgi:uncharacterized membrane protein YkoI